MMQSIENNIYDRSINGILLINKPKGFTSNHILQKAKRIVGAKKAGHTGSLDPLATGMLPVCLGKATKICSYLLDSEKTYSVEARLGQSTDTGDREGTVVKVSNSSSLSLGVVKNSLQKFIGESQQTPPMYSAVKHKGKRLYDLARRGEVVERKSRKIKIRSIRLDNYSWPRLNFTVQCSKGTYIRTLVEDIANDMGTHAHVWNLHRASVEPFRNDKMYDIEFIENVILNNQKKIYDFILDIDRVFKNIPVLTLYDNHLKSFMNGQQVEVVSGFFSGEVRVYASDHSFIGLGFATTDGFLAPKKIFV
ncbi:MAG: tRNA pseudouridine(55) synthase TruB [Pseudomonadota bacterium]|nr:tRNA pseudouridine(55) synthase TruB [Gammaproteobacteria bacterium]MEE2684625.1 tRNA pseudouridine(55) synthase TruB [Pseudomonadota bacterium]